MHCRTGRFQCTMGRFLSYNSNFWPHAFPDGTNYSHKLQYELNLGRSCLPDKIIYTIVMVICFTFTDTLCNFHNDSGQLHAANDHNNVNPEMHRVFHNNRTPMNFCGQFVTKNYPVCTLKMYFLLLSKTFTYTIPMLCKQLFNIKSKQNREHSTVFN